MDFVCTRTVCGVYNVRKDQVLLVVSHLCALFFPASLCFEKLQLIESHYVYIELRESLLTLNSSKKHLQKGSVGSFFACLLCDFFNVLGGKIASPHLCIESVFYHEG